MAADYNSKYSGEQIDALLDQVASGNAGGGGGGGSTGGVEGGIQWTMRNAADYIDDNGVIELDPFAVYYGADFGNGGTILFNYSDYNYNEWRIIFYIAPGASLNTAVDFWVNGIAPDISEGGIYELSVCENGGTLFGIMAHFPVE